MNTNPSLKIWLEGQVVYGVLHGIAIVLMFIFGIASGVGDLALLSVYGIVISFVVEFVFALPAIPLLVLWLKLIRLSKFNKSNCMVWATVGYMLFIYVCARLLWCLFTGDWAISEGDGGFFHFFAGLAMVSAMIGMVINYSKIHQYMHPTDNIIVEETSIKTNIIQTNNDES